MTSDAGPPPWRRGLPRLLLGVLLAGVAATNLWWVDRDTRIRDGDEQGVVGTVELFLGSLKEEGALRTLERAALEDWGTYPPLYSLAVAGIARAAGATSPESLAVEAAPTLFHLGTLALLYALGAALGTGWTGLLAALLYASFPLAAGLSRHVMTEGALPFFGAALVLALVRSGGLARPGPAALAGIALALGLLCKQTFAFYAWGPVAAALWARARRGPREGLAGIAALALAPAALALPWYAARWHSLAEYGRQSAAANDPSAPLAAHLLWYPGATAGLLLGPALTGILLAAVAAVGVHPRARRFVPRGDGWPLVTAWALGSLLILLAVPKKYERLLYPVGPALALLAADGLRRASRTPLGAGYAGLTAAAALATYGVNAFGAPRPLAAPFAATLAPLPALDERCPQSWTGPPVRDDLGFAAVLAALPPRRGAGTRVLFLREPPIPCDYQTAFNYAYYLEYFARVHGRDLRVLPTAEADPAEALKALREGPEVVVSTAPFRCEGGLPLAPHGALFPDPAEAARICDALAAYSPAGIVRSPSLRVPFDLHLMRRTGGGGGRPAQAPPAPGRSP